MKGEVREDFLITTLESCSDPKPKLVKGTISDGQDDAGQLDIILCRPFAHLRHIGTQCFVEKNDALCVIEVKGNCTGVDLKKAAAKAVTIQNLHGERVPQYGVVCYKVALELKTVMGRFGYSYDVANKMYFDNATIPNEAEADWRTIEYPNLDFFVSLEDGKKVFLQIRSESWQVSFRPNGSVSTHQGTVFNDAGSMDTSKSGTFTFIYLIAFDNGKLGKSSIRIHFLR